MSKQNKMRQNIYKNVIEFILSLSATLGHEACPEIWRIYPVRLHWRKLIFACVYQLEITF